MNIYKFTQRFDFNASLMGQVCVEREYFSVIGPDTFYNLPPFLQKILAEAGVSEDKIAVPNFTYHGVENRTTGPVPFSQLLQLLELEHKTYTSIRESFGLPAFLKRCAPEKIIEDYCTPLKIDITRSIKIPPDVFSEAYKVPQVVIGIKMPNFDNAIIAYNRLIQNFEYIKSLGDGKLVYGKQKMARMKPPRACKSWSLFFEEMVNRGYAFNISKCIDLISIRENGCINVMIFDHEPTSEKIHDWAVTIKKVLDG